MRILVVTPRPPWPPRRGDQVRAARLVEGLAERHSVRVLALRPPGFGPGPFAVGVDGVSVPLSRWGQLAALRHALDLPGQVALHVAPALEVALRAELELFRPDVVVLVLSRLGWLVGRLPATTPVVLDLVDSLQLNLESRARREGLLRPLIAWEARRIGSWERHLVRRVDAAVVISERDRLAIAGEDAALAARLHVLPNIVPLPEEPPSARTSATGEVLITTGNLGYFPTVDGARWFASEVWPRVRRRRPAAEWWLAGARPARALRRLAGHDGVRLFAEPTDLGVLRRRAAVAVVPLLGGSGTANKILEAMADGVPVVTTRAGSEGLDELDLDTLKVVEDPRGFADAVLDLLGDPCGARRQSHAAFAWLRRRHAAERIVERFESLLSGVVRAPGDIAAADREC